MGQSTAFAMLCRFYSFTLEEAFKLTIRAFVSMLKEMNNIISLEMGGSTTQPKVLSGQKAIDVAEKMFGGKNGR